MIFGQGNRRVIVGAILILALAGCGKETEEARGPVNVAPKESTWVKTEKVVPTKEEAFSGKKMADEPISVNPALAQTLKEGSKKSIPAFTDDKGCLEAVEPLDLIRTAVQVNGGLWGAFEQAQGLKTYSDRGMQLDSKTNTMMFSLKHLCRTAAGVPVNDLARRILKDIKEKGAEGVREKYVEELGEPSADVDRWIKFAEASRASKTREIEFTAIQGLIARAAPMIDLYRDLSQRKIDEPNRQAYLTDAVTLLAALDEFLTQDPNMVMAVNEDNLVPYENFRVDL